MWLTAFADFLASVMFGRSGAFLGGLLAGALVCVTWAPAYAATTWLVETVASVFSLVSG